MISYEEILTTLSHFARKEGKKSSIQFSTGIGVGMLRYVKRGNAEFRDLLTAMFRCSDIYNKRDTDFIIFYLDDKPLAAGTYTRYEISYQEDELVELTKVIENELLANIKRKSIT